MGTNASGEKGLSRREMLAATGAVATAVVGTATVVASASAGDGPNAGPVGERPEGKPVRMAPGKIYVITGRKGEVIGTARLGRSVPKGTPIPGQPTPEQGHKVHELDYTPELEKLKSPAELHKAVGKLIRK